MTIERVHAGGGSLTQPRENDQLTSWSEAWIVQKKRPRNLSRAPWVL